MTVGDITVDDRRPRGRRRRAGADHRPSARRDGHGATRTMRAYAIPRDEIRAIVETSPVAATVMRDELLRRYG